MRKLLAVLVAIPSLCGGITLAAAQTSHTPDQAKALVEKAVAFYKTEGREKALAAFSDPKGQWVDGDLYLVVHANEPQLTMLAHVNKGLIGKPQIDVKDADGRPFNQDMHAALAKSNDTWITYKWVNPGTKKIAVKKSYFVKLGDDVIIGAGAYEQ